MSNISNRFFVTAIDDGTTLHGVLSSDKSLTQGWNGSSADPDWSIPANQPMIILRLASGNTEVPADNNVTWKYNGNTLTFDSNNISQAPYAGLFKKGLIGVSLQPPVQQPYLRIIDNLASSGNVDVDVITLEGSWTSGGAAIPFSVSTQVRITSIGVNGYIGIIEFNDGISNFTESGQSIQLIPHLYGGDGSSEASKSTYSVDWYVNDVKVEAGAGFSPSTSVNSTTYVLTLNEADVVDNAIIKLVFKSKSDSHVLCTEYANVDDLQDPEYMYIQYNSANGQTATLRKGEQVTFEIWVGRVDNPAVIQTYNTFKIKLLDGDGGVINGVISGIPNADSQGWRKYTNTSKVSITITYETASSSSLGKKNITGIIVAETSVS